MIMQDEILEALRNSFVFVYISVLLSWYVVSGTHLGDTVELELKAYRLQQYDVVGTPHGSRTWKVMYEAVSLEGSALRRCVLVNWRELLGRDLQSVFGQAVGAALIVIPADLDLLSQSDRMLFSDLERSLLSLNTDMAIYVTPQQYELSALMADVSVFSQKAPSAVQQLLSAIAANTFQFSSSASVSNHLVTPNVVNVVGRLWSLDRSSPVIVLVAHYDTHSVAPTLSSGSDSNGSGVVALLELLAVFSRLYASASTRPKYNMVFLLSTGGRFNYQGSRQWIEDHVEKQLEDNVEMVICLDTLGIGNGVVMHVSKMPSETAPAGRFFARLKNASPSNRTVEITSKKINLNAETLAWEHERFSIRRLPAFTLSRLSSHSDPMRMSLLDTPKQLSVQSLEANIRTIGEAILAHIMELPNTKCKHERDFSTCSVLSDGGVETQRIAYWIKRYASEPRPAAGENQQLAANLRDTVAWYTAGQVSVEQVSFVDISLYGVMDDRLTAHRVKPAVFELLLAVVIAVYLSAVYLSALNVHSFIETTLNKLKRA